MIEQEIKEIQQRLKELREEERHLISILENLTGQLAKTVYAGD